MCRQSMLSERAYTHDRPSLLRNTDDDPRAIFPSRSRRLLGVSPPVGGQFAPHGVTADQFVLLATLARGHALTQRELARRMPSDPSTVRAMLVLLEKHGLVQRDTHPTDARARTVALTAAGRRKFRQLWTAGEPIRAQMFSALPPDEAEALVVLLNARRGGAECGVRCRSAHQLPFTLKRMKHERTHRGPRRVCRAGIRAVAGLAQPGDGKFPAPPDGFDTRREGIDQRQAGDGRV